VVCVNAQKWLLILYTNELLESGIPLRIDIGMKETWKNSLFKTNRLVYLAVDQRVNSSHPLPFYDF